MDFGLYQLCPAHFLAALGRYVYNRDGHTSVCMTHKEFKQFAVASADGETVSVVGRLPPADPPSVRRPRRRFLRRWLPILTRIRETYPVRGTEVIHFNFGPD